MIVRKSGGILVIALVVASFSAARADLAAGLVGHWMMDDEVGAVAADSVAGNDGILQGDATWAPGYAGGAVLLDGLGDYIDCGNKAAFNITDAVTLAAWLQASGDFTYPDWSGIIMRGGPNIDTFALYYNETSTQLGFKTTGTTPNWFASDAGSTPTLFDGEWHHVAATYDGATKVIYVDGAPLISAAATGKIETSSGRLLIGAGRDLTPPTHFVAGRIDEARLYNRALAAAEVKQFFPPKLQAYKPDPADGTTGVMTPLFKWTAGDTAVFHEMYIGKTPDLGPANLAGPRTNMAMLWYVPGLEPGTTYYWRVDEIEKDGVDDPHRQRLDLHHAGPDGLPSHAGRRRDGRFPERDAHVAARPGGRQASRVPQRQHRRGHAGRRGRRQGRAGGRHLYPGRPRTRPRPTTGGWMRSSPAAASRPVRSGRSPRTCPSTTSKATPTTRAAGSTRPGSTAMPTRAAARPSAISTPPSPSSRSSTAACSRCPWTTTTSSRRSSARPSASSHPCRTGRSTTSTPWS